MGSRRLVDLLEILRAYVHVYIELAVRLDIVMTSLTQRDIWSDPEVHGLLTRHMENFDQLCVLYDIPVTRLQVQKISRALSDPSMVITNQILREQLGELKNRFIDELRTHAFLKIPSDKMVLFDSPRKSWEEIIEPLPESSTDIEEMARCFALSRYGACVFHSLLIVECGLIELGREIGATDYKLGWDASCKKMKELLDSGYTKYPSLRITFQNLEQINQCAQSMKLAWRNKVNHAAGQLTVISSEFAPDVAEEIMLATRSFMRRLACDLPARTP